MEQASAQAGSEAAAHGALLALGRIVIGQQPAVDVLDTVVRIARDLVSSADEVSLTLIRGDVPYSAASTGEKALELDRRQYEVGYSPCLDSAVTGHTIIIADTASERLYDRFAAEAVAAGVASVLSVGLPIPAGTIGALNLYSARAGAFDDRDALAAQTFAVGAAVTLTSTALHDDALELARQMHEAMMSRATIEQAKGILVRDNRCTPDEAFTMLVQSSNQSNRKLSEIARSLVENTSRGA